MIVPYLIAQCVELRACDPKLCNKSWHSVRFKAFEVSGSVPQPYKSPTTTYEAGLLTPTGIM